MCRTRFNGVLWQIRKDRTATAKGDWSRKQYDAAGLSRSSNEDATLMLADRTVNNGGEGERRTCRGVERACIEEVGEGVVSYQEQV